MEYRECRTCGEYLSIDYFYYYINEKNGKIRLASPDCRECDKENTRNKRREGISITGSEKVLNNPNTYKDERQKAQTFKFLKLLGWKFNEENGIWYDDIKKTKDGEYIGVWTEKPKDIKIKVKLKFDEHKPPKIKFKNKRKENMLSEEVVNQILYDYFVNKMKITDIARKYNTYVTTVSTYTKYLYHQEMTKRGTDKVVPQNKTSLLRKKHFKKEKPKSIPTVILTKCDPIFTSELIAKIQNDYFMGGLKFYEVVEKYSGYDAKTVAYIIRRTLTKIKSIKDADKN